MSTGPTKLPKLSRKQRKELRKEQRRKEALKKGDATSGNKQENRSEPHPTPVPPPVDVGTAIKDKGHPAAQTEQTRRDDCPRKQPQELSRCFRYFASSAQLALAGAIAYFALVQSNQTETIIERAAIESRAWLGPYRTGPVPAVGFPDVDEAIGAIVVLHNSGSTPAYLIGSIANIAVLADDSEVPHIQMMQWDMAQNEQRETAIAAGQEVEAHCEPAMVDDAERPLLAADDKKVYLIGVALYSDVFNEQRKTAFCYYWDRQRSAFLLNLKYNYME